MPENESGLNRLKISQKYAVQHKITWRTIKTIDLTLQDDRRGSEHITSD